MPENTPPADAAPLAIYPAATPEHGRQLLRLIERLADYEHLTPPDEAAQRRFVHDGFERRPPRFHALLARAEGDDEPCGYAVYFETYSTFECAPTLYLEDLFVVPERRGHGAGYGLIRAVAAEALERGCRRMDWNCLDWNQLAHRFYARLGARLAPEWQFYRFDPDVMQRLVHGGAPAPR